MPHCRVPSKSFFSGLNPSKMCDLWRWWSTLAWFPWWIPTSPISTWHNCQMHFDQQLYCLPSSEKFQNLLGLSVCIMIIQFLIGTLRASRNYISVFKSEKFESILFVKYANSVFSYLDYNFPLFRNEAKSFLNILSQTQNIVRAIWLHTFLAGMELKIKLNKNLPKLSRSVVGLKRRMFLDMIALPKDISLTTHSVVPDTQEHLKRRVMEKYFWKIEKSGRRWFRGVG